MLPDARAYFDFLAKLGLTKRLGSIEPTRELIALSHIEYGQPVLDVETGVGATPVYLVMTAGCRVVAVDLLASMAAQAR